MTIKELVKKIESLKEVSIDERIELVEAATELQDQISEALDTLSNVPEAEAEEGVPDPRLAFVEGLMEEAEPTATVRKTGKK